MLGGQQIEWVHNFKYLGSMVLSSETDIKIRKAQAWAAFWKMKALFRSKSLPIRIKIDIFSSACLSILLYGSESWVITNQLEQSLDSFATNCYRVMLNIKRVDHISNNEVYQLVKMDRLTTTIQRRQLRYVGHCLRKNKDELINQCVLYYPKPSHGKTKPGRPPMAYPDYIGKLINNDTPPSVDEIRKAASDRSEWKRKIVDACKPVLFAAD